METDCGILKWSFNASDLLFYEDRLIRFKTGQDKYHLINFR